MNKKIIIGDTAAVKKKGIKYLIENNLLPLSIDNYNKFNNNIIDSFIEIIKKQDKEFQNYGIIFIRYVLNYVFHLQIQYNLNFAKKYNYEYLAETYNKKFDFNLKEADPSLHKSILKILKLKFKLLIKFFYFNFKTHGLKFPLYIFKKKYIYYGSFSDLAKMYLRKNKKLFLFESQEILVNRMFSIKLTNTQLEVVNKKINQCNEIYLVPLFDKIKQSDPLFIKNENLDDIHENFKSKFKSTITLYNKLMLVDKKKNKFMINEPANLIHKIISLSFQEKNEVINLHHGYDYCLKENKIAYLLLYGNNNNVIMDNHQISLNYKYYFDNYLSHFSKTKFETYINDNNDQINLPKKNIRKTKKVMLIGYPMNMTREVEEPYLYFHTQLTIEYKILKFLKKNNFHVIYKAHPDRVSEIGSIFNNYCDEFITDKFENVINEADIFLFTYPTTSCFGYSIMNKKRIILFDQGVSWINSYDKKFSNDFSIISSKNQYSNTPFDAKVLLKLLSN